MAKSRYPDSPAFKIRSRGRMPHWEVDDGLYFIGFRLFDSLPTEAIDRLHEIRRQFREIHGEHISDRDRVELERALFRESEHWLDRGHGECFLAEREVATIVREALHFFDPEKYRLIAWCIMPNHVHVAAHLFRGEDLHRVLHSWKSFSSKEANKVLGRTGAFWDREYWDRLIRSHEELKNVVAYIVNNPLKAGLNDWPWVWVLPGLDLQ
jgi:REP element-mobilizing transposase RayT